MLSLKFEQLGQTEQVAVITQLRAIPHLQDMYNDLLQDIKDRMLLLDPATETFQKDYEVLKQQMIFTADFLTLYDTELVATET